MRVYEQLAHGVTENNCNCRLAYLYKVRDNISKLVSEDISRGIFEESLGYKVTGNLERYNDVCDIIEELCKFRRTHNCLLEGDPGYCMN